MTDFLNYPDTATFYSTIPSSYGNDKIIESSDDVPVIFLQSTGYSRSNNQEAIDADAICFPDPDSQFVIDNHDRLEGMYILAPLFGVNDDEGWYKVVSVAVNRDHLLENQTDNIELRLKKTRKLAGVS